MKRKFLFAAIISFSIAILAGASAFGSSETTNLNLTKPAKGDRSWGQTINNNMDLLDAAYGNYKSTADDLPEVYVFSDTFNSTTGTTIPLPNEVDAVTEYSVTVTPNTRAGAIGDIYVTKTTTNFVVKCSENNTTDTFAAVVYYIGDVSNYGGSIYRRWYVSPDSSITDHGNASTVGSLAWVAAQISTSPAVIEAPGNKTYQIKQDLTLADNIFYQPQPGAIIDTDFSIRDSNYEWYKNGATNEYYLQASGGGNPNINMPSIVIENDAQMTEGNAGSLAAGEWDWNDVNGLGYSTVYVRLSDSSDPDGKSADYVEAGYLFTINASFSPAEYQVFMPDACVLLGPGSTAKASPVWWGAKTDGTAASDTTSAINSCARAAKTNLIKVKFPPGVFLVEESLNFTEANQNILVFPLEGWVIEGSGKRSTIIKPVLSEAYPVLDIVGSSSCEVRDLSIYSYTDTGSQTAGILAGYSSSGSGHGFKIQNVTIRGYFNNGAAFVASCADQYELIDVQCLCLEGLGAVFSASDVSGGVAYMSATVDSKFATLQTHGNTKIKTQGCYFSSDDSDVTVMDGYSDWEDHGSYWACTGTSSKALRFIGKSGGSGITFSGMRMETNHSDVDTIGIYVDSTGAEMRAANITGIIEVDTNASKAICSENTYISDSYINVHKSSGYTGPLLSGDITNSIVILSRSTNQDIANYTTLSGGNLVFTGQNLHDWDKIAGIVLRKNPIVDGHSYHYQGTYQKNRYSIIGDSNSDWGREFGGVAYQEGGFPQSDGGGEKVLYTYELPSFPSATYVVERPIINVKCWGKTASNANAKAIKLYLKWYNASTLTTNDWEVVSNDVTGSPNNKFWLIEGALENFYEFFGKMVVGSDMQTVKSKRVHDGEAFEFGVDTLTIEVRADAAVSDVTGYKFIITF